MAEDRAARARTAKQVLRLVDLSLDIDRSLDDLIFVEEGGEITYILDENIIEMFIRPARYTESVETFYGDTWSPAGKQPRAWRDYEAQAAMVAAEYLVSSALPGRPSDVIYMAEPHRWELADRIETIAKDLKQLSKDEPKLIATELQQKIATFKGATRYHGIDLKEDADLRADLEKLAYVGTATPLLDRMRTARQAATILASSSILEPLDQLKRIVAHPLRRQIRSIQAAFRPSEPEAREIEKDAHEWFRLIAEELALPGHRHRIRASRSDSATAMWNDARSVAYFRWLVTKQSSLRRKFVFVTGDLVLFDAYRRWHSSPNKKLSVMNEPFFMRRAVQYSPIFNPATIGGAIGQGDVAASQRATLFSMIQQAVETALLPITVAQSESNNRPGDGLFSRRRERLALKLVDCDDILEDQEVGNIDEVIRNHNIAKGKVNLDEIRDLWQEVQRLSIGSAYDILSRRIDDADVLALEPMISLARREDTAALETYVAALFDRIVDESLHLWLPLAESIVDGDFLVDHSRRWPRRLNIALDLDSDETFAQRQTAEQSAQLPLEFVFARAAKRALELQDVNNGERFAGLAVRADDAMRLRQGGAPGFDFELRYLSAVSQRYMMATVSEHLRRVGEADKLRSAVRGIDQVKVFYSRASQRINTCLLGHFPAEFRDDPMAETWHQARYYRALSERAALNLFMATSLGLSAEDGDPDVSAEAQQHLKIARGDLRLCARGVFALDGDDTTVVAVKNQLIPNVAAAEVLARLLFGPQEFKMDEFARSFIRRIEEFSRQEQAAHPLLTAELDAFMVLANRGAHLKNRASSEDGVWRKMMKMRLPLDRALLRAIHAEIL